MKMLLTNLKDNIYLENTNGDSVSFPTYADFLKYTGIDPSAFDGVAVTYEPERGIHSWFDGVNTSEHNIPFPTFDAIIDRISEFKENKDDSFYGLTLEEAKVLKTQQLTSLASIAKEMSYDIGENVLSPTGLQTLDELEKMAIAAIALGDTSWTVNVIMQNTNADGTPKRIDVNAQTVIVYLRAIRQRNEVINQYVQDEIDKIIRMTTVEAVVNYPLPTI